MNESIILAGGLGTRLQGVVSDLPKPMAPINGRPFLDILIKFLSLQGVEKIIISVGHLSHVIEDYFGDRKYGIEILYNKEDHPLGTGGAIRECLKLCKSEYALVLNGDTFLNINISNLLDFNKKSLSPIIVTRKALSSSRYGSIEIKDNRIISFSSDDQNKINALINAGVYLLPKNLFNNFQAYESFSFEADFLPIAVKEIKFNAFECNDYFIDIGLPNDYFRAQKELLNMINE